MTDLRDLYQATILEHGRHPRNAGRLEHPTHSAHGHNPLCGDELQVDLEVEDGVVVDVRFQGQGCAISQASASLMTERVKGHSVDDARALFADMRGLLTEGAPPRADLGKLAVFEGVRQFPMRVKCATLAWHTLVAALDGRDEADTEED